MNAFMTNAEYKPRTHQQFWCSLCDDATVDSDQPETGKFFLASGHSHSRRTGEYDGIHCMVMFALCCKCIAK